MGETAWRTHYAWGTGRVRGKFLEAAGVRQAKEETEGKSLIKASSGGQHGVARGIQELGRGGSHQGNPQFGLPESLEDLGREGHVVSSRVLEVRS